MKNLIVLLFLAATSGLSAQQEAMTDDPASRLFFSQQSFGDRFAVMVEEDESFGYFTTDLTKMPGLFLKAYFLDLAFADRQIISIDSDISDDQLWFKVPVSVSEHDALCKFDEMKEEAVRAEASMPEAERREWLAGHIKYQPAND